MSGKAQGEMCEKHPQLEGLRYLPAWTCVGCVKANSKRLYRERTVLMPQQILRLTAERDALQVRVNELREDFQELSEQSERRGRQASEFEERMGDLQVENGKLQDRITLLSDSGEHVESHLEKQVDILRIRCDALQVLLTAADEENDALKHWRDLALQFDHHRMKALWHLKTLISDGAHYDAAAAFLAEPPVPSSELQQRLTASDERADVLEGLLLRTNELLYAIQGDPGAVPSSAIDAMRGEVFTALKPAECRRNQCDGCQAGIPVVNGAHRMGKPDGYPDTMSCTAKLYKP